jgi:hypothetical protein
LIRLPLVLLPVPERGRSAAEVERASPRPGVIRGSERGLPPPPRPLRSAGGVPRQTVEACRTTIAAQAEPLGAIRVEAAGAGTPHRVRPGVTGAPIEARIVYARFSRVQVRQARITCQVNAAGRVLALL